MLLGLIILDFSIKGLLFNKRENGLVYGEGGLIRYMASSSTGNECSPKQNSSFSPQLLGNGWTSCFCFVWKATLTMSNYTSHHSLFVMVVNSAALHKADLIDTKFYKHLHIFLQTMEGSKKINSNLKVDRLAKSFDLCQFKPFRTFYYNIFRQLSRPQAFFACHYPKLIWF